MEIFGKVEFVNRPFAHFQLDSNIMHFCSWFCFELFPFKRSPFHAKFNENSLFFSHYLQLSVLNFIVGTTYFRIIL